MIRDLNVDGIGDLKPPEVCIVGSGPAGMTAALALSRVGHNVVLLEGGGLDYEEVSQDLYEGLSVGRSLTYGMQYSRLRFLGGSSNCWAGGCTPLDPIDFTDRPWVPHSGWPIDRNDLDPYYRRAEKYVDIEDLFFEKRGLLDTARGKLGFDAATCDVKFLAFNATEPMRFGTVYRAEAQQSKTLTIVQHCNVEKFIEDPVSDRVDHVVFRDMSGKINTLKARFFILACGGIENPRILLNSQDKNRQGLGNGHDLVGRYFMDHPISTIATILPLAPSETLDFLTTGKDEIHISESNFVAYLTIPPAIQEQESCLNSSLYLAVHEAPFGPGMKAAFAIKNDVRDGHLDRIRAKYFADIVSDLGDVSTGLYQWARHKRMPMSRIAVKFQAEQSPNPDSRVTLADKKDRFGVREARLDWRTSALDRQTLDVSLRLLSQEMGRLGLGRVKAEDWVADSGNDFPETMDFRGGQHHTGTTRMGTTADLGVVDRDCKVYGVNNLYVGGSSVFPTNSWVNPTFTIVALALRLADTLAKELAA